MTAKLLDGKKVAARGQRRLAGQIPSGKLAAILVGDNPASVMYLKKKQAMAEAVGVEFALYRFAANATQATIIKTIRRLNADATVDGMMVQLPLPAKLNVAQVVNAIDPAKDVDGLTDANIATGAVLPATARGILELWRAYRISPQGKQVALVGFTRLLNVPLSAELARMGAAVVILQKGTRDKALLKTADIIITAAGVPKLITARDIKAGAVVVDAGIARVGKKIVGDVLEKTVSQQASWITPVPGGVGPMTVVALFANLQRLIKVRS